MATKRNGHATGTVQGGHDLRRRNVPASDKSNGSLVREPDTIDIKKSQKVLEKHPSDSTDFCILELEWIMLTRPAIFSRSSLSFRSSTSTNSSSRPSYLPSWPSSHGCTR